MNASQTDLYFWGISRTNIDLALRGKPHKQKQAIKNAVRDTSETFEEIGCGYGVATKLSQKMALRIVALDQPLDLTEFVARRFIESALEQGNHRISTKAMFSELTSTQWNPADYQ